MQAHPGFELDWNLVRTFVGVAQAGSLAAGARRLGITHPTAARHIQQLEAGLDMLLFSRTSRGLVLNEAGQGLLDSAVRMHASALAFQASSEGLRKAPQPRIRVTVAEILAEWLPELMLAELTGCSERAAVAIDMLVTNDEVDLQNRDADMALRHVRPTQQDLICRLLGSLRMGVYAHHSYAQRFGVLAADNISSHRFIDGLTREYMCQGAARRGWRIEPEQIVLRSDSVACKRAAVRAGWGVAALPRWMGTAEPDLVSVLPAEDALDLEVWLVARPEARNNEHLHGVFSRLGSGLSERLQSMA